MSALTPTQLRGLFAERLSLLYGAEVPAYNTLVEVAHSVNRKVVDQVGQQAERLGSIERVTAERHGAIRVGSPRELSQVSRIFAAMGMYPTGFYDLRDALPHPIPVVSTAFRPQDPEELAQNPFRVFTSMLVPEDRRFFDADLEKRLKAFLKSRTLFPDELLELADLFTAHSEISEPDADRFLDLAAACFALSSEPIDQEWYEELTAISSVAADIGGVSSTHINHLTPRVLDIDELYNEMQARGIEMIERIQGPPRWNGPDVLLRQTSFKALAEPRRFREPGGALVDGDLRVRFGEVEARGIALTPRGRALYTKLTTLVDESMSRGHECQRERTAADVWADGFPSDERTLAVQELAYFTFASCGGRDGQTPPSDLAALLDGGWVTAEPIVYEDFLPRSAAGIFASNLSSTSDVDVHQGAAAIDIQSLSEMIGSRIVEPDELYAAQQANSLREVAANLGLESI